MPLKSKVLRFHDLLPLSVSSVAPAFSISASLGALYSYAGTHLLFVVVTLFPSFFISSLALRMLNSISPNAGASYHWGNRFIGPRYGSLQAWIVTLAYFLSIPPIVLPAAQYTLQLLHILGLSTGSSGLLLAVTGLAWICISSAILITGARPTALLTLLFLLVEGFIIAYSCLVGLEALGSHASVKVRPEWFIEPTAGIMPAFLVGATIMDGWEIDSYAAEEAIEPKYHPGKTGILGLVMVTCIYLLLMPLILSETPGTLLASSLDPLYTWISTVSPGSEFSVVLAVVLSTATSLWLTAFILSRAWFSLGRDRIFPKAFEKTNRRGAPIIPVLVMMVPVAAIDFAVSLSPHVFSYFSVLLGFSGLFLTLEFMFDNATCAWVSARNGRRVMAVATGVNAAFLCSLCVYYTVYSGLTSLLILALFIPTAFLIRRGERVPAAAQ